jgi:NitT/TauT family transport system substrate-binding protein
MLVRISNAAPETRESAPQKGLKMTRVASGSGRRRATVFVTALAGVVAVMSVFGGATASGGGTAAQRQLATVTVNTLPISNGLPLDLGIKKGFFQAQGIEISKRTLQSGNDIVLALANRNGEIGYVGWVPAMIARTQGIPLTAIAASDVEGTSATDNWQNILVKGSSSIRTPADLAGKTIAVNALKGVGEVMIKAALKKRGVNPNSVRLTALPFPAMRSALNNGQVDAIWTPEPFMSQALNSDGARIVMAPGPVLGKFWPIGTYVGLDEWATKNPGLAKKFRAAINQSLSYAQANPNEIRELLPAATRNVRLPIWSPVIDRQKLTTLAKYSKEFDVISTLPNLTRLVPASVTGGKTLSGTVGNRFITLRLDGKPVTTLPVGRYTFVVTDNSKTRNFRLVGPGLSRSTSVRGTGRSTWTVTLRRGKYTLSSSGRPALKRTLTVR